MNLRPYTQIIVHDYTKGEGQAARRDHREVKAHDRLLRDRTGAGSPVLLVSDPARAGGFVARPGRVWVRLLARLGAGSLDRRLASGRAPESGRLLAARAERLTSGPVRRSLARHWRDLSTQAAGPPVPRNPRVPLCRARIIAADSDIRALTSALSTPLSVPVQGVAMANRLLRDGAGPLYNRSCPTDLSDALRRVIQLLDPAAALAPCG